MNFNSLEENMNRKSIKDTMKSMIKDNLKKVNPIKMYTEKCITS